MKFASAFFLAVLLSSISWGQDSAWKNLDGSPQPQSSSQKMQDGFSGMLIVTPDQDWKKKWDTPESTVPTFSEAGRVSVGGVLTTLIFFSNPKEDASGIAHVLCNIQVIRPDGSYSVNLEEFDCFKGSLEGRPMNVRLSAAVLQFTAEATDLVGEWTTEVHLIDTVRNVRLVLKTKFELIESEA